MTIHWAKCSEEKSAAQYTIRCTLRLRGPAAFAARRCSRSCSSAFSRTSFTFVRTSARSAPSFSASTAAPSVAFSSCAALFLASSAAASASYRRPGRVNPALERPFLLLAPLLGAHGLDDLLALAREQHRQRDDDGHLGQAHRQVAPPRGPVRPQRPHHVEGQA